MRMDPTKVEAIKEWPMSQSVKDVQGFLGLTNYYHKFVRNYTAKSKPLTSLLKKKARFVWNEGQEKAFRVMKEQFNTKKILVSPNHEAPFKLETDASRKTIGVVLY